MEKAIGFGVGLYPWKESDHALIRFAIDNGASVIDTAQNYGISEIIVGKAISGVRDRVSISSKFAPEYNHYPGVVESLENSLVALNTDYVDIYSLHWPNYDVPFEETYRALNDLQLQGKIRRIGLCNVNLQELNYFLKLGPIGVVQMEFNLFDRWSSVVAEKCREIGADFLCYSPLDQGIINDCAQNSNILNKLCLRHKTNPATIILSWLIAGGKIPIFTSRNRDHIKENIKSLNITLDEDDILALDRMSGQVMDIEIDKIIVSDGGHGNRKTYVSIDQAIANELNYCPSPLSLAMRLLRCREMKPIKLNRRSESEYSLIEGRVRYWAWRMAFGEKSLIPSLVRETQV